QPPGVMSVDGNLLVNNTPVQGFVSVIDVNPANPTFNQVVDSFPLAAATFAGGIAVDSALNKVWVAGGSLYQIDGSTHGVTQVPGTSTFGSTSRVVLNEATHVAYAVASTNFGANANLYGVDPHAGDPMNPPPTVFGPL